LREKLLALAALQKVDVEVAALKKTADAYPKDIERTREAARCGEERSRRERTKLDELERQRTEPRADHHRRQGQGQEVGGRLTEQRSTREYSALAREIDIAKKGQATMAEEVGRARPSSSPSSARSCDQEGRDFAAKSKAPRRADRRRSRRSSPRRGCGEWPWRRHGQAADAEGSASTAGLLRRYDTVRKKRMPAMASVIGARHSAGLSHEHARRRSTTARRLPWRSTSARTVPASLYAAEESAAKRPRRSERMTSDGRSPKLLSGKDLPARSCASSRERSPSSLTLGAFPQLDRAGCRGSSSRPRRWSTEPVRT
jgi:hypothetical protein